MVFVELCVLPNGSRWTSLEKRVVAGKPDEVLEFISRRVAEFEAQEEREATADRRELVA